MYLHACLLEHVTSMVVRWFACLTCSNLRDEQGCRGGGKAKSQCRPISCLPTHHVKIVGTPCCRRIGQPRGRFEQMDPLPMDNPTPWARSPHFRSPRKVHSSHCMHIGLLQLNPSTCPCTYVLIDGCLGRYAVDCKTTIQRSTAPRARAVGRSPIPTGG